MSSLPPGIVMLLGGLVLALLRGRAAALGALLLPAISLAHLLSLPEGTYSLVEMFGYALEVRIDGLSLVWGYIFHGAAFLSALYALHVRDTTQHVAAMLYAGSAIGAVFSGDMISLFVYWEITAISSVFLIWASRTPESYKVGLRYLVIQVGSGVLLLAGVLVRVQQTGSITFESLGSLDNIGNLLIFFSFGIKCAFPFLHNWLQDSYPQATPTGTVFLSAFTTKLAVYALARGFAGTEVLITIGVIMTLFPIFFAVIENDLRKVLAYSLNNQLGFMVVGIGIGTEMSLNGTAAHAFCHILYKALLFMSMGAVLYRTGTCKATELGGLFRSMPITAVCCIIGAMSISAFPLFSGFVSKSMILTAAADGHHFWIWLGLVIASAGVMEHSGIKIPFFAFFAHDSGKRVKEAPLHMLIAMCISAFLCVAIGVYPDALYAILPYEVNFEPYTGAHVITQFQLLLFAMLAFIVLLKTRSYPDEVDAINLDTDVVYRRWLPSLWRILVVDFGGAARRAVTGSVMGAVNACVEEVSRHHRPDGILAKPWTTGGMVIWAPALLGFYLLMQLFF